MLRPSLSPSRPIRRSSHPLLFGIVLLVACDRVTPTPAGGDSWLDAAQEPHFQVLNRQLRGLDVAMMEIDHRFAELHFAGLDGNWPYAAYQAEKLRLTLDLALERRPARAASARAHFSPALDVMDDAVAQEDSAAFARGFAGLVVACNACHVAEDVPTFRVVPPSERRSSIRGP